MDNALCGGTDTNQGISSTAAPITSANAAKVKAVILMGDPRHTPGASYNVGTSTAAGVCFLLFLCHEYILIVGSLILDRQASLARMRVSSRVIAMQLIRIAQMGTMPQPTRGTEQSMVRQP